MRWRLRKWRRKKAYLKAEMIINLMLIVQNQLISSALTAFTDWHKHIAKMLYNENIYFFKSRKRKPIFVAKAKLNNTVNLVY